MKTMCTVLLFLMFGVVSGQTDEFGSNNSNGLIYSDAAISKLRHIVDSLNLKFKVCDSKVYYSKLQGRANYIRIDNINVAQAKRDIEAGLSFKEIEKKYPHATVEKNLLGVRHIYKDYNNEDVLYFQFLSFKKDRDSKIDFSKKDFEKFKMQRQGWFFTYKPKSEYSKEFIEGYYFEDPLTSVALNNSCAKMVQYSDCLIDSTASVYLASANRESVRFNRKTTNGDRFLHYFNTKTKRPVYEYNEQDFSVVADTVVFDTVATVPLKDNGYDLYATEMKKWTKIRFAKADSLMEYDRKFKRLFDKALNDGETTDDEFEEFVARYVSKEKALFYKRSRRVVGGCSMDQSPRIHAMNIAQLAGETAKWEIFLRSHLDIMNDRFDRVSDGSYAQAGRATYIKELEVLDIDVANLLLGISLRVENPAENHYSGSIGRIGRSLSESKDRETITHQMLNLIRDNSLDDYNRMLMAYLFLNYNHNLSDEGLRKENLERLDLAVATLPQYIASGYKNP